MCGAAPGRSEVKEVKQPGLAVHSPTAGCPVLVWVILVLVQARAGGDFLGRIFPDYPDQFLKFAAVKPDAAGGRADIYFDTVAPNGTHGRAVDR